MKKFASALLIITLAFVMSFGSAGSAFAADRTQTDAALSETADKLAARSQAPTVDESWVLYGLSMAGYPISDEMIASYKSSLETLLESKNGQLTIRPGRKLPDGTMTEPTDSYQYSEYSKYVIICTDLGIDPTNIAGYSLVDPLADFSKITKQGINGPIWALMALDSCGYNFSSQAIVNAGNSLTTKEKLIDLLIRQQKTDGGWAWTGNKADPDITGMVIRALAPHYNDSEEIKAALDRAKETMSAMQLESGDFATIMETGADPTATSESTAQIVCALSKLEMDPNTDERYIKGGNSAIDAILSYYFPGEGGFMHIKSMPQINALATEQCFYALAHYYKYVLKTDYMKMNADKLAEEAAAAAAAAQAEKEAAEKAQKEAEEAAKKAEEEAANQAAQEAAEKAKAEAEAAAAKAKAAEEAAAKAQEDAEEAAKKAEEEKELREKREAEKEEALKKAEEEAETARAEAEAELKKIEEQKAKEEKTIKGVKATTVKLTLKRAKKSGKYNVKLTWKKSGSYKMDYFQIQRSLKKSSGYKLIYKTKKGTIKTYTVKNLKKGKTFWFRVRGVRKVGDTKYYSKWSNKASVKIPKK